MKLFLLCNWKFAELRLDVADIAAALCQVACLSPFYHLPPSEVSRVGSNCINMQEFIDCLPWLFCWEGLRVLQSPSALITRSWQVLPIYLL